MPEIKENKLIKTNRHFGFIVTGGFLVMGALIPFIKHKPIHLPQVIIAVIFLLIALIAPHLLERPRQYWLWLGEKLGLINTKIFFTLIYLSLFSIVHLVFIIIRRDRMKRLWKKYPSTYQVKTEISSFGDPF
ncbi:MAG: SxtJ family membrane protein [Bacteriovorax sp.]|nr:SxtJ family membrane protein [Bacteriovorax sp.]